jgi:hypothetical protein
MSPFLKSAEPRPQIHSPGRMSTITEISQQITYHHTNRTMAGESTGQLFLGQQARYLKAASNTASRYQGTGLP